MGLLAFASLAYALGTWGGGGGASEPEERQNLPPGHTAHLTTLGKISLSSRHFHLWENRCNIWMMMMRMMTMMMMISMSLFTAITSLWPGGLWPLL